MSSLGTVRDRLGEVLEPEQANVLAEVITESYSDLVKTGDFNELKSIVKDLATAQKRTEQRVEELAQAQKRTEQSIKYLSDTLKRFEKNFEMKIGALGARWGLNSEAAFRETISIILEDTGFSVERYLGYDEKGDVFSRPEQIEIDLIVKNGKVIVAEIKSSADRGTVNMFARKIAFYEKVTGQKVTDKMIISPFIDPRGTKEDAE